MSADETRVPVRYGKGILSYVVDTSLLPPEPTVVSGGAGVDVTFEQDFFFAHPRSRIIIYEFIPKSIEYIFSTPFSKHYRVVPRGLSSNKTIEVFVTDDPESISSSEYQSHRNNNGSKPKTTVECDDIPKIIKEYGVIDVLKLNIEGSEHGLLLTGLNSETAKKITQICVETHYHQIPELSKFDDSTLMDHLRGLGYETYVTGDHVYTAVRKTRTPEYGDHSH